jgi:DNA-binding transcriptional ArsR family regulator
MSRKSIPDLSDDHLTAMAHAFSVLAEPARLRILRSLMVKPLTVKELIKATGMKQGNVSKHLGILLGAAFVAREPHGNFAQYSIADPTLKALCALMCGRVKDEARSRARALR